MKSFDMPTFRQNALGILAGNGVYPVLLSDKLHETRIPFVVAGLKGQTAEEQFPNARAFALVAVGAFRETADFFLRHGARHIFFAGGVRRKSVWRLVRPDDIGLATALSAVFSGDDTLLRKCAAAFARLGIEVLDPSPFLRDFFVPLGHLAGPAVSENTLRDIETARNTAMMWGRKDKGQAAVVCKGRVMGREGRGGTDALIERSGCKDAVLVKMVKPGQDRRFDLPSVGVQTVEIAFKMGISALGLESGGVLLLCKKETVRACNRLRISLYGLPGSGNRGD